MKIGVVADTHISGDTKKIPSEIYDHFRGVDLILHAGDLVELWVLKELGKLAPVKGVYGNMDPIGVRRNLPSKDIIKTGRFKIGLIHGSGPPAGLLRKVKEIFKNDRVDVIVFGHSHNPLNLVKDGVLFFNPGSPTDELFAPYKSCGILEIDSEIKGQIIKLGD